MEIVILLAALAVLGILYAQDNEKAKKKREEERKQEREQERQRSFEREEQAKIRRDIQQLADIIVADWNVSVFSDKVETPGNRAVIYRFENGDIITYLGSQLIYKTNYSTITYTLGVTHRGLFTAIFNRIVEIINSGKTATRPRYNHQRRSYTSQSRPTPNPVEGKSRKYTILMETIKLRKENLAKMARNHPDRKVMENELRAAERVAAGMSQKH